MQKNMKSIVVIMVIIAILIPSIGCGSTSQQLDQVKGEIVSSQGDTAQSSKARNESPDIDDEDIDELVAGNTEFALDLYQQLRESEEDFFFSPYSISIALAITYAGARNDTEKQMADTLHFTLDQERLHESFNALDLLLSNRSADADGQDEEELRLDIVNSLWGQNGYGFLANFLDLLAENYGAGMRLVDFISAAEEARADINEWVEENTEGKIKDLIPNGAVSDATRLVLVNAIYFNAAWKYEFDEDLTNDDIFHLIDGTDVTVPMMRQTRDFLFTSGDGYQVIELPYEGEELSMVIMLPDQDTLEDFESSLDTDKLDEILADLSSTKVSITMPRFEFAPEESLSLKSILQDMGMSAPFNNADFSGMDGTGDLFISDILHKAFISVNEAGTEAAAATAAVIMYGLPINMTVDHPFLYFIRDIETDSILFMGRVMDPTA